MGRKKRRKQKRSLRSFLLAFIVFCAAIGFVGCEYQKTQDIKSSVDKLGKAIVFVQELEEQIRDSDGDYKQAIEKVINHLDQSEQVSSLEEIPAYAGETYVIVNQNEPVFTDEEMNAEPYEFYSELDWLGRCGYVEAKITPDMMPTEERGKIGMVRPTGWHTVKYEGIDGNYLYNRCHLLGYQLTGENANEKNLITGTRYLNVEGMLPFENQVADYIERTGNTVMMRVSPVFEGANLVASGVQMEAKSIEDHEICFNVYIFNIQPGIEIDYATGESKKLQ
jgi:DNA-entry nuclease